MRLLDSTSLQLHEFLNEDEAPAYAILSHTWGNEEVSFQEMCDSQRRDEVSQKAGYMKIVGCCKRAVLDLLQFVWIDTCCIDKTSSAELSEAINSMYRWYQNAAICYAYLVDVLLEKKMEIASSGFTNSRWFTRGWTLQELIAPRDLIFYSAEWQSIGTRGDLKVEISTITGIDVDVLSKKTDPKWICVAQKMSWASRRTTTRREDIAYCLMGIFGVNMPLLYGEGDRAFQRLQEEILNASGDDQTIFAWEKQSELRTKGPCGILAKSPLEFANAGYITPTPSDDLSSPYSFSRQGVRIELMLFNAVDHSDILLAALDCVDARPGHHRGPVAIYLERLWGDHFGRQYPDRITTVGIQAIHQPKLMRRSTIHLRPTLDFGVSEWIDHPSYWFYVPRLNTSTGYLEAEFYPQLQWRPSDRIFELKGQSVGMAGSILFKHSTAPQKPSFVVTIAVDCNFCVSTRVEEGSDFKLAYEANEKKIDDDKQLRIQPLLAGNTKRLRFTNQPALAIRYGPTVEVNVIEQEIIMRSGVHKVFGVHISISDSPEKSMQYVDLIDNDSN